MVPVAIAAGGQNVADVANGIQPPKDPKAQAHSIKITKRMEQLGLYTMGVAGVMGATGVGAPAAIAVGAWGAAVAGTGMVFGWIAEDPPDSNFKVVAKPQPIRHPAIKKGGQITGKLAAAGNRLLDTQYSLMSYGTAMARSIERAQGAYRADNSDWYLKQKEEGAKYSEKVADILKTLDDQRAAVVREFRSAGIPWVKKAAFVRFQKKLRAGAKLPAKVVAVLRASGMSKRQIKQATGRIAKLDASKFPDNVEQAFMDRQTVTLEEALSGDLDRWVKQLLAVASTLMLESCTTDAVVPGGTTFNVRGFLVPEVAESELTIEYMTPDGSVVHTVRTVADGDFSDSFVTPVSDYDYDGGYFVTFEGDDSRGPAAQACFMTVTGTAPAEDPEEEDPGWDDLPPDEEGGEEEWRAARIAIAPAGF